MYRQAESPSLAYFWIKIRALVWTFPLPFLFHFLLILTQRTTWLKKKISYILIYGPAVLFSSIDLTTPLITGHPEKRPWGFTYGTPDTWINWASNGWTAALGVISLIVALHYFLRTSDEIKKKQAKYITLGISLPILSGILSEIVLPGFHIRIPELTSVSGTWLALMIGYTIWKYELFSINPAMAAENIIATMNEMFFLLSPEGTIIRTNKASLDTLGFEEKELEGQAISRVCEDEAASRKIFEQIGERGYVQNVEAACRTKSGARIPVIFSGSAIRDRRGRILGIIGITRDISERKRMEEELRALSLLDELTGLHNRRGFLMLAEHQKLISDRAGREMMLVYADLDGLKKINDTYGHAQGDAALVATAKILRDTFRSSDVIARLGGDEFVVLAGEALGHRPDFIRTRLEENIKLSIAREAFPFTLSLSVGLICYDPRSACSIEELLAKADQAMYAEKQRKKRT